MPRLRAHANMLLSSDDGVWSSSERSRWSVPLGQEFNDDLEFRRWVLEAAIDVSDRGLAASVYRLVARQQSRTLISDASEYAVVLLV